MFADERLHHLDAFWVINNGALDAMAREEILGAEKGLVLTDDDSWNLVEQRGSGAHDTRAQRTHQNETVPVGAASGVADAHHLRMRSGIAGLHTEIVAA